MKKRDLKNILVPVDFSPISEGAIETAQRLARRSGATVHLVHVHQYFYSMGFLTPGAPVPAAMITFSQEEADQTQQQLANLAKNYGIPMTNCYVRNDIPVFNGVCKAAKQTDADLIVLQTHGRTGISRIFDGSQAERIVQHSPCPVLVVRKRTKKASDSINTILVPVDFSPSSFKALEYAIDFADRVAARLVVFHAVHLDLAFTADGYAMCDLSALIDGAQTNAKKHMQEFIRSAKFRAVKFETAFKMGAPASEICNFAEKRDVDLIITATHGRTGLKHMLMGSVAERVVRHAQRPVLVVPSHPKTRSTRLTPETRLDNQATVRPPGTGKSSRSTGRLKKQNSNLLEHPFPERHKTNKFRESHAREG